MLAQNLLTRKRNLHKKSGRPNSDSHKESGSPARCPAFSLFMTTEQSRPHMILRSALFVPRCFFRNPRRATNGSERCIGALPRICAGPDPTDFLAIRCRSARKCKSAHMRRGPSFAPLIFAVHPCRTYGTARQHPEFPFQDGRRQERRKFRRMTIRLLQLRLRKPGQNAPRRTIFCKEPFGISGQKLRRSA